MNKERLLYELLTAIFKELISGRPKTKEDEILLSWAERFLKQLRGV
jgi:hypothetical protein